jgi:hypothetical protein
MFCSEDESQFQAYKKSESVQVKTLLGTLRTWFSSNPLTNSTPNRIFTASNTAFSSKDALSEEEAAETAGLLITYYDPKELRLIRAEYCNLLKVFSKASEKTMVNHRRLTDLQVLLEKVAEAEEDPKDKMVTALKEVN